MKDSTTGYGFCWLLPLLLLAMLIGCHGDFRGCRLIGCEKMVE
jgi:hypothetical protein